MRTTSAAWAAALAVMTLNGATSAQAAPFLTEEEQIRALPRIVRRQILNNTLPIVGQPNSPPRNSETSTTTSKATQSPDLLNIVPIVVTATATTVVTVEPSSSSSSSSPAPKSSSSAQELLPPLVVLTTTTATASPRTTTRPTTTESTDADSSSQAPSASSNPGLLGPLLSPILPTTTTTSRTAAPTRTTTTTATTATGGGLLDLTLLPIPAPTTTATTSAATLSSTPPFLVGLSTVIESTTAATSSAPATTPLLGLTLPFNLLPTTTTTIATTSDVATITAASSTPATGTGLLGLSLSILPTLPLSSVPVPVTVTETSSPLVTAPTSVSVPVVVTSLPVTIDTGSAIPTQSFTLTTSGISVTPVPVTSTIPSISVPIVSDTGNATASATPTASASITASISVQPPVSTSVLPPVSISISIPGNATTSATASVPAGNNTVTTAPAVSTTLTSERPPTTTLPVVSIVPTGTNTLTSLPVSTGLVFATSAIETGSLATALTQSTAATMPTGIPQLIQPPGGQPSTVPNVALIQVGFTYALNYPFVAGNPTTIGQIFTFLPQGIAYGLGLKTDDVKMNALVPYNTSSSMGYITTLAQAYIPADKVNQMQLALHQPTSNLYQNPDATVRTLMSMINPTLPLFPGASVDDPASGTNGGGSQTSSPKTDAAPIGGDSGSSSPVKGTSVGIGVGAVAGAALYAAAMVFVARRYRQKKRGHQRSPSVQYSRANMSERASGGGMGTFFMSGANGRGSGLTRAPGSRNSETSSNGRSVRDAGISAPVTSSNSLGW